ncbi:MAG TPA: DUF4388 domain-containing protein [Ktedonobacteraceae bacterium]|nr:DUF4388 domain-containing protein [Ktedonobacteraceae bacterium]
MSQQRETVTDRLVSVIRTIQLGRQTGVLTAQRGEGVSLEEGIITFVNGQVTQAALGRRAGSEALNALTIWGNCRYTFVSPENQTKTSITASLPTDRLLPDASKDPRTPIPFSRTQTEPLYTEAGGRDEPGRQNTPAPFPLAPYRIQPLESALRSIERLGLSRTYRHLLLLIDGERSITDLIRLMGRNQNEVYELLRALERAAIIKIPAVPPYR